MHSVADTFEFPMQACSKVVALLRTPNSSFGQSHSLDVFNAGCEEDARFGDETNPGFWDDAVEGRVHCGDYFDRNRDVRHIILQNASTRH